VDLTGTKRVPGRAELIAGTQDRHLRASRDGQLAGSGGNRIPEFGRSESSASGEYSRAGPQVLAGPADVRSRRDRYGDRYLLPMLLDILLAHDRIGTLG
jgi:hypothetical protein